ncbi:hypothetical protein C8A03DRAFT_31082 [Achaetomium macrosporum]|uniref:Uncharacterized protein n=1 Tax=Achaetomium macrosporum TaxID=79813 RepID=A0AAN7CGE1_9PEZI|nr:hypothetical protein C8A03DRAFT_31082 [Achaetomium macrosporum]
MATRFEKLDKKLDRLEKLFSRKKRPEDLHDSDLFQGRAATRIFSPESDGASQRFPQPSFIRPTSSRMVAREEVLMTPRSTRRARSLPESSPSAPRLTTSTAPTDSTNSTSSEAPEQCSPIASRLSSPDIPRRSSSLYPKSGRNEPLSELMGFSFPSPPKGANDNLSSNRRPRSLSKPITRPASMSVSPKAQVGRKRHSAGAAHPPSLAHQQETNVQQQRAQQWKISGSVASHREDHCLGSVSEDNSALSLSPKLVPMPGSRPDDCDNNNGRASQRPKSLSVFRTDIKHDQPALRKSTSLSRLPTAKPLDEDPILEEPTYKDFLALSDNDIADGHAAHAAHARTNHPSSKPPTFALPPRPSPVATLRRPESTYPMLTLSPALASRPATAAAFEAARIAIKHHFDLIYVVNLWPSHMSHPSRSSPLSKSCGTPVATYPAGPATTPVHASPNPYTSGDGGGLGGRSPAPRGNLRNSLTGRLLAAYGLPSIMYPFQISGPVHEKILRTDGWLEYRNKTGALDEFARGYSCSFHTCYSPAGRRDADTAATTDGKRRQLKNKPANRGIVFAAFRLPREDGTPVGSDEQQLEALHKDAEGLVNMLIDIHKAQRQRGSPATPSRCVAGGNGGRLAKPGAPLVAL